MRFDPFNGNHRRRTGYQNPYARDHLRCYEPGRDDRPLSVCLGSPPVSVLIDGEAVMEPFQVSEAVWRPLTI